MPWSVYSYLSVFFTHYCESIRLSRAWLPLSRREKECGAQIRARRGSAFMILLQQVYKRAHFVQRGIDGEAPDGPIAICSPDHTAPAAFGGWRPSRPGDVPQAL